MRSSEWGRRWLYAALYLLCAHVGAHAATSKTANGERTVALPASAATPRTNPLPSSGVSGKLDLKSSAALVIDANSAAVLYSKQAQIAAPIASITKLMTALVVLETRQSLEEKIEITKADRDSERSSFSRLRVGAKLSRGDLLHLALMSSENRAAHALGRNYPGGLPSFVRAMNAKAAALGMKRTQFVDPTGLSSRNVASPEDLATLVIASSRNPVIRQFSTDERHTVRVGKSLLEFRNTNILVSNPEWDIAVQKTGFINEAGKCLVMQAAIGGKPVVIVLLNSFGKYTRTADARRIRKWMEAARTSVM